MKQILAFLLLMSPTAFAQASSPSGPCELLQGFAKNTDREIDMEVTFIVTVDGTVRDVAVSESSGIHDIDETALRCVGSWTYKPAIKDGKPIEMRLKYRIKKFGGHFAFQEESPL